MVRGWPASLIANLKAAAEGWSTVRGGWRSAWRDAGELIAHRRVMVETRDGVRLVLRSRMRLNGDVQTEILRSWVESAPRPAIEALAKAHFRSLAAAAGGWRVVDALCSLASQLAVLIGAVLWFASVVRAAFETGWGSLLPLLLANRWSISGLVIAALGMLFRSALRIWVRWQLRRTLAAGA